MSTLYTLVSTIYMLAGIQEENSTHKCIKCTHRDQDEYSLHIPLHYDEVKTLV